MRRLPVIIILFTILYSLSPDVFASTSAERAEELFLEGRYDKALIEADKAIDTDSGKKYELYYLKGLSDIKLGKFIEARREFEYVIDRYPRSGRALDSHIGVGDAYFLEGNTQGALRSYKAAADVFPDDKNIIVVRQRITDCMTRSSSTERPKEYVRAKPVEAQRESVNFVPKTKAGECVEPRLQKAVSRDKTGQFSIQVGSFKSRLNAYKLASKLSARRYEARVESPAGLSDKVYRVKVGRISSKEEAEKLAARLKCEGYPIRVCQEE